MKGHAFRKLSRTSSHRSALLRNLVTSLLEHERISTTVAKAKEAAREAEKIITLGKRGTVQSGYGLRGYLYSPKASLPKVQELVQRYADRPGGYTRIHLHGNRIGDNAPRAILEFVDNPYDIRMQMTARTMAKETYAKLTRQGDAAITTGPQYDLSNLEKDKKFQPLTRKNIAKVVKYGGMATREKLVKIAEEHLYRLKATVAIDGPRRVDEAKMQSWGINAPRGRLLTKPYLGTKTMAGEQGPDQPEPLHHKTKNSVIRIGQGAFAKRLNYRTRMVLMPESPRPKARSTRART